MNHTQQFVGSSQQNSEQSLPAGCVGMRQCARQKPNRCSYCPLNSSEEVGFGASLDVGIGGGVGISGGYQTSLPASPSSMPSVSVQPPSATVQAQTPVVQYQVPQMQMPSGHVQVGMGNNFAPAMQELNRRAQINYLQLAMRGGWWAFLVIFVGFYTVEFIAGRFDPFNWHKPKIEIVGEQEPPKQITNREATTTSDFSLGDGNYMFRIDHDRKIIQMGKLPLDAQARFQLVSWRADGYVDVPWPGNSSSTTTGSVEQDDLNSSRLLQLLRDSRGQIENLRYALENTHRSRFTNNERQSLLNNIRGSLEKTNEAIGMVEGTNGD